LVGPDKHDRLHEPDELLDRLTRELRESARDTVEQVRGTMPEAYFHDTDRATMLSHLTAIIAARASGLPQEIRLRSEGGERFTVIHEGSYPGQLAELVGQLPHDRPLMSARVYTATDGSLVLDVFEFAETAEGPGDPASGADAEKAVLGYAAEHGLELDPAEVRNHLAGRDAAYLEKVSPRRISQHVRLLRQVRGSEDTVIELVPRDTEPTGELRVGVGHVDARMMFERIARYLGHRGVDIRRAYLNSFDGPTSLVELRVATPDGGPLDPAND
jgi:UTP:GlnB (protein PII) uridylyltransferase